MSLTSDWPICKHSNLVLVLLLQFFCLTFIFFLSAFISVTDYHVPPSAFVTSTLSLSYLKSEAVKNLVTRTNIHFSWTYQEPPPWNSKYYCTAWNYVQSTYAINTRTSLKPSCFQMYCMYYITVSTSYTCFLKLELQYVSINIIMSTPGKSFLK